MFAPSVTRTLIAEFSRRRPAGELAEKTAELTPRELEVLRHLAAGRSNAGIAQVLVTSRRTVEAHLRSVFVKLGLEEAPEDNLRVQAALAWLREGAVAG